MSENAFSIDLMILVDQVMILKKKWFRVKILRFCLATQTPKEFVSRKSIGKTAQTTVYFNPMKMSYRKFIQIVLIYCNSVENAPLR